MSKARDGQRGWLSTLGLLSGWVLVAVGSVFSLLYAVPWLQLINRQTAMIAAFIPYGTLAWAGAVVLFAASARGWNKTLALLATPGLVVQLVWASSYLPFPRAAGVGDAATVFTLNSRCDAAGMEDLAAALLAKEPDLVVIPGTVEALQLHLEETGVVGRYPHQLFFTMPSLPTCGTIVYSKTPLRRTDASSLEHPAAEVELNGVDVVLVPADTDGPHLGVAEWLFDLSRISETVDDESRGGKPLIVVGDFNAVREHLPFRQMLSRHNLVDATQSSRAGWQPTYRADGWYRPLVQIDHILVSFGIEADAVESIQVGNRYAHRALMATLRVSQKP